jgi:Kef-type K+ transport system membrane component KefB
VAIIEIMLGAVAGNLGLKPEAWMIYVASLGGIVLTFLAGTEIDAKLFRARFKESFLIGFFRFSSPLSGQGFMHFLSQAGRTRLPSSQALRFPPPRRGRLLRPGRDGFE